MATAMMQAARLGKIYWFEYVRLNAWPFSRTNDGIAKQAQLPDLTPKHVRECINVYLAA